MALDPVVLVLNRSGESIARRIASTLGLPLHGRAGRVEQVDVTFDNTLDHARDLFAAGRPIVGVCASGILIRAVAPLLNDKTREPPVISVSDDAAVVVPLLGGHRGANRLAADVAEILGATSAVTTAGDVSIGVALDSPPAGWRLSGGSAAKEIMAGLLAGEAYTLTGQADWLAPLSLCHNVTQAEGPEGRVTLAPATGGKALIWTAQHLVLGLGCARGTPPTDMINHVFGMFQSEGIDNAAIACIATIDLKADEPAMHAVARELDLPIRFFPADELETQSPRLANPSDVVFAEVGCHGVAEGAALAAAGRQADLLVEKQKSINCTCAVARAPDLLTKLRGQARGRLSVIGIGPGQSGWRTPEASRLIAETDELVGYGLYIDLLGPLAAGKKRSDFPLGGEEARCRYALEAAGEGRNVALVCSGDAGIYA
ncbi:MAG: cobalamin biosynthesis protein, partial [Pseudomonadota bacterium]